MSMNYNLCSPHLEYSCMSDLDSKDAECNELKAGEVKSKLISRFTDMIKRMKEGVPLIRRIQSDIREKNETTICMAFLSNDLKAIKFVKQSEEHEADVSVSVMQLSAIDAVGYSTSDKHGVGLLVGSEEVIVTLILASEDDWNCWYSALRVLCARGAVEAEEDWDRSSQGTAVQQDTSSDGPLLSIVEDAQNRNDEFRKMMLEITTTVDSLTSENERLKKLLLIREGTITELSQLIQVLLRKQRDYESISAVPKVDNYFIGSAGPASASRRDSLWSSRSRSSTASTPSTPFGILEGLEGQLRQLEARKQQLETMLESVAGS